MRMLLCILLAATVFSARAENTRISVEGTLQQNDKDGAAQWVVRADDGEYTLRFVDDSVRRFVLDSGLAGARVKVQGELRVDRADNKTDLIIVADSIVSPENKAAVAVGRPAPRARAERPRPDLRVDEHAIDTSVDTGVSAEAPAAARNVDNVSRAERRQVDVLDLEPENSRRNNSRLNRVGRRDQDILDRRREHPDGPDVIMLPGGGAIIRNNR